MSNDRFVYFDNAASLRPYKECLELFSKISDELYGNPSSIHDFGNRADDYLKKARKQILSILIPGNEEDKRNPFECFFTSGATEGNNIAILGSAHEKASYAKRLVTTTAEHDSVAKVFDKLEKEGFEVVRLQVSKEGDIDWDQFFSVLKKGVGLISAIYCSNQTGVLLPIKKMAGMAKEICPRAYFHTDATQAVNKIELELNNVDLVTFSGHKIGAVRGSGVLLKRRNVLLVPPEVGGGQEDGLRSGTSNTPGDATIALALRLGKESLQRRIEKACELNRFIRNGLKEEKGIEVFSPFERCIPFVLTFGLVHQKASVMDEFLSSHNIYVSTTSACDDKDNKPNAILRTMGFPSHQADNPIRLSFSGEEDEEDAKAFLYWFKEGLRTLRNDD